MTLREGTSWASVGAIVVWCEEFAADFGHLDLRPLVEARRAQQAQQPPPSAGAADEPAAAPQPAPEPPAGPAGSGPDGAMPPGTVAMSDGMPMRPTPLESVTDLQNCVELLPGYYNLYWEVRRALPSGLLHFSAGAAALWRRAPSVVCLTHGSVCGEQGSGCGVQPLRPDSGQCCKLCFGQCCKLWCLPGWWESVRPGWAGAATQAYVPDSAGVRGAAAELQGGLFTEQKQQHRQELEVPSPAWF